MQSAFKKLHSQKARLVITPPQAFDLHELCEKHAQPFKYIALVQGLSHLQGIQHGTSLVDVRNRITYDLITDETTTPIHSFPSLGLLPPQKEGLFTNYLPWLNQPDTNKKGTLLQMPDVFFCALGPTDALFHASVHCLNALTS